MIIKLTSKDEIAAALKACLAQMELVNNLSLEVNDTFQRIVLNLDEENKITEIMNNDKWPVAVDNMLIVRNSSDKYDRAAGIVFLFLNDDVSGKKILDFGCGDGSVSKVISDKGAVMSVGYDINKSTSWDSYPPADNMMLTTDFSEVSKSGPFNIIILYDVLDHVQYPVDVLNTIKGILAPNGIVYLRCHPWCSRHGGHTYRSMNKAFSHLLMSSDSVLKLSDGHAPVQKVIHPRMTYSNWFDRAGFTVVSNDTVSNRVEAFFKVDPIKTQLVKLWQVSPLPEFASGKTFPDFPMSQSFIDYVITIK